ncbi:MAG: maleylpyruvate isomerase family mycothiol-dependent enzyme [Acidimicrobiia bacterium]
MTSTTQLDRATVGPGTIAEYESFADLLESLSADDWRAPTRCEGFEVRDVAGHVVGLAEDVAKGVPGSRTAEQEAATVREDTPEQAGARLRAAVESLRALLAAIDDAAWEGPSPVPDLSLARGVLTLWYDTFVHGDDIRAAIGRPSARGAGLGASVAYLAEELERRGWGPAEIAVDGLLPRTIGTGGPTITGDPLAFVLVATGRGDPASLGLDEQVNIYRA